MKTFTYISLLLLLVLYTSCACDIVGSRDLGKNFTLLEGDKKEDRAIVYCLEQKECCTGGKYVIPKYENHYNDMGDYNEYVERAESNARWIIVKSVQIGSKGDHYWLIDKNFDIDAKYRDTPLPKELGEELDKLIQSNVIGPLNLTVFKAKLKELDVSLRFD